MRRPSLTALALLTGAFAGLPALALADAPGPTSATAALSGTAAPASTTPDPVTASASAAATATPTPAPAVATPSPADPATAAAAAAAAPAPSVAPATAAVLPTNVFTLIGRAKVGTNGTITLIVTSPTAGKYLAFATVPAPINDVEAAGASARPSPQPAPLPLPYGTATTTVPAGAQVPLYFRPGKAGREALVRLKRPTTTTPLRVTLAVSFVPPGGLLRTVVYVVKIAPSQIKKPR